jgi:hypothetical protein
MIDVCIVCADYAQVPGQPHEWQQCPRLALPPEQREPASRPPAEPPVGLCICGDTAGCHQDGGTGGCWACACHRFEQRTSAHRVPPNYGFRYTGD